MVSLTFEFNEEIIKKDEVSKADLLKEMRSYAAENNIKEIKYGVFEKNGDDALATILNIATKLIRENSSYMEYIKKMELDVDGEKEDCIKETKEWLAEKML